VPSVTVSRRDEGSVPVPSDAVDRLYHAIAARDPAAAIAVIEAARIAGLDHDDLFEVLYIPAMARLGAEWARGAIDETAFAEAAFTGEQVASFVTPAAASVDRGVTLVVGCLEGDHHTLREDVYSAALKTAGYRVIDLGVDTPPSAFLTAVDETGARIVVAFAETIGAAVGAARVREALDSRGAGEIVLLLVGGPFEADPEMARALGGNAVASSAQSVLRLVGRIVDERLGAGA
jgi:methanogenic corrinoid protein MtbC1